MLHTISRRTVFRAGLAAGAGAVTGLTQSVPASAEGYYYLAYDAEAKAVKACRFVTGL